METKLLESILSELQDIRSNTNNYDQYDSILDDVDTKLGKLVEVMEDQVKVSETISDQLDRIEDTIPSSVSLGDVSTQLRNIHNSIDSANTTLTDININTSQ